MPRKPKPAPKPARRDYGSGSVAYVERRRRWRARLPRGDDGKVRESWHLTRQEAEAWIVRELARDPDSFDPTKSLDAYMTYWFGLVGARWKPQTARRYKYEAASIGALGRASLLRLRGDQFQAAGSAILARGCTRRYAYNVLSLYKRALADAVKWKILAENVVDTVTLPDPERKPAQAWTVDETRAVLKAIVGHRFEAVYLLILWGGLRIGEAVSLRWDQIADDGTVSFGQAEWSKIKGRPIGATKRERERETEIPPHVVARLQTLRKSGPQHLPHYTIRAPVGVAYVYVAQRPDGNRWTADTIREDWNNLVATVKLGGDGAVIKPLRPHGGRKSFGTMHMVSGTPLADLSTLMGHASPAITAASYLATSKDRRREAARRMAALIGTAPGAVEGQIEGQGEG